ncbi:MAG: transglutaminase domain-containing protein [Cytophagales bacterium]
MKFGFIIIINLIAFKSLFSQNDTLSEKDLTFEEFKNSLEEMPETAQEEDFDSTYIQQPLLASYSPSIKIIKWYQNADLNKNNKLEVFELQQFQNDLCKRYKYKNNVVALNPDQFINQGRGDCEDFAIITCNLLRFYGETAYVASFGKYSKFGGHCLCFWKVKGKVPSYATNWYKMYNRKTRSNDTYIPIDYQKVGGLTAIDGRFKPYRLSDPEEMYGKVW